MSLRTHPRAVGAFVLGAVAIVLGAVVLLSAGDWFEPKDRFAVFFPGSVRGLQRGAPVTFRGVKVGEVKDVTAFLTGKNEPFIQIEVVIEFSRNVIEDPPGSAAETWAGARGAELAQRLVDAGIRGRMLSQSLLTGQKYIEFDFLPGEEARFAGLSRRYPELPTTGTSIEKLGKRGEELADKLAELPIAELLEDLQRALQSLRSLAESGEVRGAISGTRRAMAAATPAIEDTRMTLAELRRLSASLDAELRGAAGRTSDAARQLQHTLERSERSLKKLEGLTGGADETRLQAERTLQELQRTLAALRGLLEYAQTHPEAFVLGKAEEKEER